MNASDRSTAGRAPLPVELLASEHQRRCLLVDDRGRDQIDPADEMLNESRRVTSSLRACLAAEAWVKMNPDGAPIGRPKKGVKDFTPFAEFCMRNFKANELYAKQALAILNAYPDLIFQPPTFICAR